MDEERDPPMRAAFVNENIGGHAALHRYVREAIRSTPELGRRVRARGFDVPAPGLSRRLVGIRVPGLAALDLDLQPLRAQLAVSAVVRDQLSRLVVDAEVLHLYTQNAGLLSSGAIAAMPSVVSTDATVSQNGFQLPYRQPTRFTPATVAISARLERRVFGAATRVVAHSRWAADAICDAYDVPEHRVQVIPFGVPVLERAPRRPVLDLPQITFIGTTMDRKGGWELLDLFERHLRGRAKLNLVTRDAVPAKPDVEVFGDLVPGDPRLLDLLATTSVLAFPSRIDKYSFAVLEAMAAGVAPVVYRVGGVPELVEDTVSGLIVDDADGMAAALEELVEDPLRAERLGANARARVLERFDARVTTAVLLDVLEATVREHPNLGPIHAH